jgi:SAM-dependent methyltransferase
MKKLNLGCGNDIRPGWINLDRIGLPGVDVIHDVSQLPLPFPDGSFDVVECLDVLEHLEYIPILRDVHRILAPGGRLSVRVPHFTSSYSFGDPTHRKLFSVDTLRFFVGDHERGYYFDFSFSKIEKFHLAFAKRPFYNHLVEWLVNRNERMLNLYECSPLRIFPATNIEVVLVK